MFELKAIFVKKSVQKTIKQKNSIKFESISENKMTVTVNFEKKLNTHK